MRFVVRASAGAEREASTVRAASTAGDERCNSTQRTPAVEGRGGDWLCAGRGGARRREHERSRGGGCVRWSVEVRRWLIDLDPL